MGDAEVGAEFRLGELLLGAKVDLFAKLDSIEKRLSSIAEREQRYEEAGPVQVELRDSGTVDANQDNLYIGLGGPSYGRVWEVRQLVIGGVTWATTVAGYALFFVQPVKPSAMAGVPLANIQDAAGTGGASLPSVAFYSGGQFRIRHPNHLYIAVIGGTASTQYVVAGDAFDMPDRGVGSVFTA